MNGQGHLVDSELWSVGCVIYALLCGSPPFQSESRETTYLLIKALRFKIPPELSLQAVQFIMKLLDKKPLDRGNLNPPEDPRSLLGHPFLSEGFTPASLPPSAVFEEPHWDQDRRQPCQAASLSLGTVSPPSEDHKIFLKTVEHRLKSFLGSEDQVSAGEELVDKRKVPVFVSRWVDYAEKFGFVFQLSDGGYGVLDTDHGKFAVSSDGKTLEVVDVDGEEFCCDFDHLESHRDMKLKYENLKTHARYLARNLQETILSDSALSRVSLGQSTKLPQMVLAVRTEDCVVMLLNTDTVQVNFLESHKKVIIWAEESGAGDLLATIIFTVGRDTRAQTVSLSPACSCQEMPGEMRRLLRKTRRRISRVNQCSD